MDGHKYEFKCAEILKRKGFSKVKVTKGSGDQGIDVIAYSGGKKYGIQCKYYTSPVGNHAVQEAFSGAKYYDCDVAVVMTNSTFTKSAKDLAKKNNVLLWGNNKIPVSDYTFNPLKYSGILFCIIGGFGLILQNNNAKFYALQNVQFIFLIIAGFFNIFEYGSWGMPFIASIFYLISGIIELFFSAALDNGRLFGCSFYILFAILSFVRSDYLHLKTNRYHIWKNRFQQFIYDNFKCKKEIESISNEKLHTNLEKAEDENLKLTQNKISEVQKENHIFKDTFNFAEKNNKIETNPAQFKPEQLKRKVKKKQMNKYEIEQYAKECNAYVVKEERKERGDNDL